VRGLTDRDEFDKKLGKDHLKIIQNIPTPTKDMEMLDVQRAIEEMAEEYALGQVDLRLCPGFAHLSHFIF